MVIKSPFKDYYDFVAKMYGGGDPRVVYPRHRVTSGIDMYVELESCSLVDPEAYHRYKLPNEPETDYLYLIIAGKAYLLTRPTPSMADRCIRTWKSDYDLSSYKVKAVHNDQDHLPLWVRHRYGVEFGREYKFLIDLCRKVGAPVFVISGVEYTTQWRQATIRVCGQCPILERLGVANLISPQQLYQELAMFVGNQMKATPDTQPPVQLGNKQKIVKAGFDLIQSFRNRV